MKTITTLFTAVVFCLAAMQAQAQNPNDIVSAIHTWNSNHGGTGSFTASASVSTVTVTGSVTGAKQTLALNIGAGVTVYWQANLTGSIETSTNWEIDPLIGITGAGTIEIRGSGSIIQGENSAGGPAIQTTGNVMVTGNAIVNVYYGTAIHATGETSKVTLSDCTITVGDYGIYLSYNTSGTVTVHNSTITAGDRGIYSDNYDVSNNIIISGTSTIKNMPDRQNSALIEVAYGNVTITDYATVSNAGIYSNRVITVGGDGSSVTVSGNGRVISERYECIALDGYGGTVIVRDKGKVLCSGNGSTAIAAGYSGTVFVEDEAEVSVSGDIYRAIEARTVSINGGMVSVNTTESYGATAISAEGKVLVSGTGIVQKWQV